MSRARPRFGHAHTPCHGRPGPTSASSMNVIGQFGVGFYSVFMVADEVAILSRRRSKQSHGSHRARH